MSFSTSVLSSLRRAQCAGAPGLVKVALQPTRHSLSALGCNRPLVRHGPSTSCGALQVLSFHTSSFRSDSEKGQNGGPGKGGSGKGDPGKGSPHQGGPENGGSDPNFNADIMFLLGLMLLSTTFWENHGKEVSFNDFVVKFLQSGEVSSIEVSDHYADIKLHKDAIIDGRRVKPDERFYFKIRPGDKAENMMRSAFVELGVNPMEVPVLYGSNSSHKVNKILSGTLHISIVLLIIRLVLKASIKSMPASPFKIGAAQPTIVRSPVDGIKFDDVAGMSEAKEEVKEFVDYLTDGRRFRSLGARIPKGAILYGPPGTGKTLLAKAVSSEASVPFLAMAGSDFVEMFGGVGAARVRSLFEQAKACAPCIIFIDEVDAVGRKRAETGLSNSESEQTLNQLLVEMDGMDELGGIVVMASTNRIDILDKALLRPGRFDRKIEIALPTHSERVEIFKTHMKNLVLDGDGADYAKRLASLTPGHSGADVANICNEAALHAGRNNQPVVGTHNFEYAVERILAGSEKRTVSVVADERKRSASYEAGRCVVSWFLENCPPPLKTSILPRSTSALGYTRFAPVPEHLQTREMILDALCALVGGRAAEVVLYGDQSSLGERHLKQATKTAERFIQEFGMGDSIGNLAFDPVGKDGKRFYSNGLRQRVDKEISQLLRTSSKQAVKLLMDNKDQLEKLTAALKEKEVLNFDEIKAILGEPPYSKEAFMDI